MKLMFQLINSHKEQLAVLSHLKLLWHVLQPS